MTLLTAVVIGVLVIATLGVVSFVKAEQTAPATAQTNGPTCGAGGGCGNACTAGNNCGLSTCGATQGKTCGCGK